MDKKRALKELQEYIDNNYSNPYLPSPHAIDEAKRSLEQLIEYQDKGQEDVN
jgi:hypothetical protein